MCQYVIFIFMYFCIFQLTQEKEEQERRDLQKMIMGEGKDDDKSSKKKKGKEEEDNNNLFGLTNHPGRVLKIHRTFKNEEGKKYTRTEIVRKPSIIDIYMRIRTTKDELFIRQFALLDDQAKEEMKKEKRRIQEQLRRIKRNQEKESRPSPQKKKKIKLKPELKMKCGACGQVCVFHGVHFFSSEKVECSCKVLFVLCVGGSHEDQ